jgi:hypothetical protein
MIWNFSMNYFYSLTSLAGKKKKALESNASLFDLALKPQKLIRMYAFH